MNLQKPKTRKKYDKADALILRLKNIQSSILLFLMGAILMPNISKAQDEISNSDNFNFALDLKNMHLWHGFVVTPGVMMASCIEYVSSNQKFIAGLWGGANYNGAYKEFSYYTKYCFSDNINVSLISHNNYSDYDDPNIFSYNKFTSPNFVDVVLEYTLSKEIPLTFYWSTILFGNGGDFESNAESSVTYSYSNYAELRYKFLSKKPTQLSVFAEVHFRSLPKKHFTAKAQTLLTWV